MWPRIKWVVKMNSLGTLEAHVRERVRERGLNPAADRTQLVEIVTKTVQEYDAQVLLGHAEPLPDPGKAVKALVDVVAGLGPLQQYLDDPHVEEIWINSPRQVFIARDGVSQLTNTMLTTSQVKRLVEQMLATSGRRLDLSHPFVDAMLPGGERLHVVIPDITRQDMSVNIRKFVTRAGNLSELVARTMLTHHAATFLDAAVRCGLNILVSGATGAGKTTFLRALAGSIPTRERVITVEEVFELNLQLRDVVAMQCRQSNLEGTGEITLRRLVKEALRMRPDRIVVGEVREAEALDLLIALNSGLPGLATIHANSARDAVLKTATLPLLAGENVTAHFVNPTVASSIDLVVHLSRGADGLRTVREIYGVSGRVENGHIETTALFETQDASLCRAQGFPPKPELFEQHGIDLPRLLNGRSTWE